MFRKDSVKLYTGEIHPGKYLLIRQNPGFDADTSPIQL